MILRTFAVADDTSDGMTGHGFSLLPGGLTRAGAVSGAHVVAGRGDSTSKDTWVASSEPAFQQRPWLPSVRTEMHPVQVPELPATLPGRVAAQLFVLGRSAEHAELVIRLIRTVLARLDQPFGTADDGGAQSLQVLLSALGGASGRARLVVTTSAASYCTPISRIAVQSLTKSDRVTHATMSWSFDA